LAVAVGVVFVAFEGLTIVVYQGYGAVEMVVDVELESAVRRTIDTHYQYFIDVIAVHEPILRIIGVVIIAEFDAGFIVVARGFRLPQSLRSFAMTGPSARVRGLIGEVGELVGSGG